MREVDLFTKLLESTTLDNVILADILHKTVELLQSTSTLFFTLIEINALLCIF